jgi:PhnB protein
VLSKSGKAIRLLLAGSSKAHSLETTLLENSMTRLTPYLGFDGNCAEAMRFYEKALGGRIDMTLTYGESPMAEQLPAEHRKRVMHSALSLPAGGQLFAADKPPGSERNPSSGFNGIGLTLEYADVATGEAAFKALAEGGSVSMPMAPSFWVERFGMLTDRYGVGWMVNAGPSKM